MINFNFLSGDMVKDASTYFLALGMLILANVIVGTANSIAIQKAKFDTFRFLSGLYKAFAAIVGFFALAYVFDIIDMSKLGFTPLTILSAACVVYAFKLGQNLVKLFGLEKYITLETPMMHYDYQDGNNTPDTTANKTEDDKSNEENKPSDEDKPAVINEAPIKEPINNIQVVTNDIKEDDHKEEYLPHTIQTNASSKNTESVG